MQKFHSWIAAACAGTALLAAAPAMAQFAPGAEVVATGTVNVRTGPGTGYGQVGQMQRNEVAQVRQCQSGWCFVDRAQVDGWVSGNYLAQIGGGGGYQPPPNNGGWNPTPTPPPQPQPPAGNFNQQAQASTVVNVRSGPGTNYGVVDTLRRGETVQVGECRGSWCLIRSADGTGWVSQSLLIRNAGGAGGGNTTPVRPGISISGPNFSFSIGAGANFGNQPPRPEQEGRACFFENWDYTGRNICINPGDSYSTLGSFDNMISSIRLEGNIEVQVCENADFRGRCAILNQSQPRLQGDVNDVISSFRAR